MAWKTAALTEPGAAGPHILRFEPFELNTRLRMLSRRGEKIQLSAKPFATLEFLIENRHRVVSKAELLDCVWGGQREISTVEHAVGQVRKALGDNVAEPRYIETVPGQGYHFITAILADESIGDSVNGAGQLERRQMLLMAVAGLLLVCLTGFAAIRLLRKPDPVSRVTMNGKSLVAMNAAGGILWIHEFDAPLVEASPEQLAWRTQIVDLDGDGIPEVLLAAAFTSISPRAPRELFCFSSMGKLLWHYVPTIDARFNTRDLNGPWQILDVLVVPGKGSSSIWVAVVHDIWWPSFIVRISAAGVPELIFSNPGNICKLVRIQNKAGSFIVAAGVNNEYRQASVAILAESGQPASSPQTTGSEYQCIGGCPSARPDRYILLPRSEVNIASDQPYNIGTNILLRPGGLTVQTNETGGAEKGFYDFSQDLQPERSAYGGNYREVHERFEREGRITHRFEDCPERKSGAVLRIFDEKGNWSKLTIPRLRSSD